MVGELNGVFSDKLSVTRRKPAGKKFSLVEVRWFCRCCQLW